MRQQELVHLHALLLEIRRYIERNETLPAGAFAAYDAQSVRPTHIHCGKEAHEEAIAHLLGDLIYLIQKQPPPDNTIVS